MARKVVIWQKMSGLGTRRHVLVLYEKSEQSISLVQYNTLLGLAQSENSGLVAVW